MPNMPDYSLAGIPRYDTPLTIPGPAGNPIIHPSWYRFWRGLDIASNGIAICTQATFPDLSTLAANSLILVTDFAHLILWDGSAATFADDGNDYYVLGTRSTDSPGWHAVDGSTVDILNPDGTLTSKTLLNVDASTRVLAAINGADALNAAVNTGDTSIAGSAAFQVGTGAPLIVATVGTDPHHHTPGSPASFSSKLWYRL